MPKSHQLPELNNIYDPMLRDAIRETAHIRSFVIHFGGVIPEGHKGPYVPTKEEFVDGIRAALEDESRTPKDRDETAIQLMNMFFDKEENL